MKKIMIISFALCVSASLTGMASGPDKAKVPKNYTVVDDQPCFDQLAFSFEGTQLNYNSYELTDVMITAPVTVGTAHKVLKFSEADIFIAVKFDGNFDPGGFVMADYKSPFVDTSWIWKYQHYHNC